MTEPMRIGRDEFETDPARQQHDDARYDEGRGLIGGDPSRRPAQARGRPIPEDQPYFRLTDLNEAKKARLQAFLGDDSRPLEVEVGFGSGEFLLGRAAAHPEHRFLGFEVKRDLCHRAAKRIGRRDLANVWIGDEDARWALPRLDLASRVSVVHVLYPDPWWKRKHQVKRLFRPPFVALLHEILVPGGLLHVRTDVAGYGQLIQEVVAEHGGFASNDPRLASAFDADPPTRREAFCRSIQRPFWVLGFIKQP